MKLDLTFFSRGVLYLMAFGALAICLILLPEIAREQSIEDPANAYLTYPFLIGSYITSIPFFVALHHTYKLLRYIDENKAFSDLSVKALQNIKICAIAFSALIIIGALSAIGLTRSANPTEDVTHIIVLGFIFTFASSVIATFASVLQRLLQDAIRIKAENELIV